MLNSHEIASVPIYVLINYRNFLSDKELVLLLHFQAIQQGGKAAWNEVANRMGYKSTGPINKMLNKLEESGCIVINRGTIDATPLYNKCLSLQEQPETFEPKPPPTNKKNKTHYQIAAEIKPLINVDNMHGLAGKVKTLIDHGATPQDVLGLVKYLDSWYDNISKGKPQRYLIPLSTLNKMSLEKWVDGGKKEKFIEEKKKVFTKI